MAHDLCISDFAQLERDALGLETMRLSGTLIDKVPLLGGKIPVFAPPGKRDCQTVLALISHDEGALELVREDNQPIDIEYYDHGRPTRVLASPVDSLLFSPVDALSNQFVVREAKKIINWTGFEFFTTILAGRALKKQRQAGIVATRYYAGTAISV